MRGTTPKQRAKHLAKILKTTYDPYGAHSNVIDMLTDLRHVCDANGWGFADLDRQAFNNYLVEKTAGTIGKGE